VDSDILFSQLRKASPHGLDLTANLINSEVVPSPEESSSPLAAGFRRSVPAKNRGYVAFEGWLNAAVATEALRRCKGQFNRAEFARALASMRDWDPGLGVKLASDPVSHQALHTVWVAASDKGKWVPVAELTDGRYEEHPR
jgi:Periplasmic binding protein